MSKHTTFLTSEQVFTLNEKHGWFQFGDAQSDVSKAFAQDAIATHERVRDAAAELLEACNLFVKYEQTTENDGFAMMFAYNAVKVAVYAAIAKATKETK